MYNSNKKGSYLGERGRLNISRDQHLAFSLQKNKMECFLSVYKRNKKNKTQTSKAMFWIDILHAYRHILLNHRFSCLEEIVFLKAKKQIAKYYEIMSIYKMIFFSLYFLFFFLWKIEEKRKSQTDFFLFFFTAKYCPQQLYFWFSQIPNLRLKTFKRKGIWGGGHIMSLVRGELRSHNIRIIKFMHVCMGDVFLFTMFDFFLLLSFLFFCFLIVCRQVSIQISLPFSSGFVCSYLCKFIFQ